ncbi:AAA family ATPase [Chondromyces crocatus]|uniref:ATPase AAA n=1 Tax=Chondromyces crocatus TaxID=52 RepID=A0A0K1EE44_CHOCO|nr:MoxR family ATPase [Chondromyces crocatus]AKT39114.1 ATPase AAA [Chondromyces crocatus]
MSAAPVDALRHALGRVMHGKADVIELLLVAVLGGGHVLVEDVPGVGKTTLAKALARAFRATFTRVQFTPDLLPSDILGAQVLHPKEGTFSFHRGPVFTHVLLADEINRASPRTQSALLEAMSEAQATVDGVTHPLPRPFLVIATQNPVDYQGTYPLPEAQLDRFLLRIGVGYPSPEDELRMIYARQHQDPLTTVEPVASTDDLLALQTEVREVEMKESVGRYLLSVVTATREHPSLALGVSPRGALALFRAAQARAYLAGRRYISPDDVQALTVPVLAHRLTLTTQARYGGLTGAAVAEQIVEATAIPT